MTYAWTQDVPIDMAVYDKIKAVIGPEVAEGMVVHVVSRIPGGLRYLDVWESQEACDRFFAERVHPALGAVFSQLGIPFPEVEPARTLVDVTEVWLAAPAPASA